MSAVAEELTGDHLARVLRWARDRPNDSEALYDAGYALYEQRLYDIAATLLARAHRLAPGSPTLVTELAANLEALLLHGPAAAALRASGLVDTDATCGYLYGYNALLSGDVEAARPVAAALRALEDPSLSYMGAALGGMVARADALRGASPLDSDDLAGWHLVINGAVLLHLSPRGYAAEPSAAPAPMRGRYGYVADSYALLREGIDRLAVALGAARIAVPRVFALPDRGSRIVALAAAEILGAPCEDFAAGGDDRPGLVVAYDLDRSGAALERLREHRPGQVLFAHASCWTDPFPYAPDVTTYLCQSNVAPWDAGRSAVDPETGAVHQLAEDEAPVAELAAKIVAATGDHRSMSTTEQIVTLVTAVHGVAGEAAAGLYRTDGPRLRQRVGSPVVSHRFP